MEAVEAVEAEKAEKAEKAEGAEKAAREGGEEMWSEDGRAEERRAMAEETGMKMSLDPQGEESQNAGGLARNESRWIERTFQIPSVLMSREDHERVEVCQYQYQYQYQMKI